MKKLHLILLIITATMAAFSAYSLAAINQVYQINYQWYSEYHQAFLEENRSDLEDRWNHSKNLQKLSGQVFTEKEQIFGTKNEALIQSFKKMKIDFKKDVLLYFTLGTVPSPEYRIKVLDIVQRGNVVEVKLSLNSPMKQEENEVDSPLSYDPEEWIKISRDDFPIRGKLYFIFKNQAGNEIGEGICTI